MSDGSTRDFLGCNGCVIRVIPLFPGMRFHECSMFLVVSGLKFETPPAVKCEAFPAEKIRRVHSQNRKPWHLGEVEPRLEPSTPEMLQCAMQQSMIPGAGIVIVINLYMCIYIYM